MYNEYMKCLKERPRFDYSLLGNNKYLRRYMLA